MLLAMTQLDPVISAEALQKHAHAKVLFDARSGPKARAAYAEGHLPGAVFADLDRDLADVPADAARGGRHPLPSVTRFAAWLGECGVTPERDVVVYDDQGGMNAAARLWWMLRAIGHERVQVLDGGLKAALTAGFTLTHEAPEISPAPPYPAHDYAWPRADIAEVDRVRSSSEDLVLDVRAAPRYLGEQEPIDPIAGHIPGARNMPLTENLAPDGHFKARHDLRARYGELLGKVPPTRVIVHCGSGVTACHTLLALERAGLHGAKLYVGSWGEWCRQAQRPRATGSEPARS
jgi:thiosulfate/3-mercaptopyruvate sulfurtransferase